MQSNTVALKVLSEFNIVRFGTKVFQDNKSFIEWPNGGPAKDFSRRRYVDIMYHFVIGMVYDGQIELLKTLTVFMDVYFLSKQSGHCYSQVTCAS